MEYAIVCEHVYKKFGDYNVLNDLSIKIPKGKITSILGFSGAGKSTLLKHILGLMHPTEGELIVLGKKPSEMNTLELREFRTLFGMVFQYAALFDSMNTFDNVAFPLKEFTNLTKSQIKIKVEELLISVGLTSESFLKLPSELSGGMRKRVGLARALALSPKIMLYDEPTTGLDPITTKMVNDLIKETSDKNKHNDLTSIIISHDVQATLKISDYIAFLEKGTIVEYLAVEEFVKSQNPTIRQFLDLSF
jgi:phospholipid/cholesterol/gamma-HCH transport system ATP-binding protein